MIRFAANTVTGRLYGFGLTEANLNRLQFNREFIFIDFATMDTPGYFGLIVHQDVESPHQVDLDLLQPFVAMVLDEKRGVTVDSLRAFVLDSGTIAKLRKCQPFTTNVEISKPDDIQMFFWGRTEDEIKLALADFIGPSTRKTRKGFG